MVLLLVVLAVAVVGLVAYAILHPLSALRKLARFIAGTIGVLCIICCAVLGFSTPGAIWVAILLGVAGVGMVVLYNTALRPRR